MNRLKIFLTLAFALIAPSASAQSVSQVVELLRLSLQCPVQPRTSQEEAVIREAEQTYRTIVSWRYVGDGVNFSGIKTEITRTHRVYENEIAKSDSGPQRFSVAFSDLGMVYASSGFGGTALMKAYCKPDKNGCVKHDGSREDSIEVEACSAQASRYYQGNETPSGTDAD